MSREIKFRIWHYVCKKMLYDFTWPLTDGNDVNMAFADLLHPLMQFTGLLDKNGKEIYEGDIVKWNDVVDDGWGGGYHTSITENVYFGGGAFYPVCQMPGNEYEVIGNIYENPKLWPKK